MHCSQTFEKYVRGTPRPYTAFALFTATPAHIGCATCLPMAEEFELAAQSYEKGVAKTKGAERDMYFFVADYPQNEQTFKGYQVSYPFVAPAH